MKYFIIAIVFGILGYFIFFYEAEPKKDGRRMNNIEMENQKIKDELGIENTSYQGAMMQVYDSINSTIQGAHDAADSIENKQYTLD
jgi:formylmethanofuran:tetrahydromethanopterin formyltransferase